MRRLSLLFLTVVVAGCTSPLPPSAQLPSSPVFPVGADQVTILPDSAATFATLHAAIEGAQSTVEVEMYELGRRDLLNALIAAWQRGVAVTVIVDPSVDVSAAAAEDLRAHGVDVLEYPIRPMMIDHAKLLIVDHQKAIVGGINWGATSWRNHDFDAEVHGPTVHNLERVFLRDEITAGRRLLLPDPVPDPAIQVLTTLPQEEIRPRVLAMINAAQRRLDLALFVLTDTSVVHALIHAHDRGVQIHLLLDPSQRPSDLPAAQLQKAGLAVRRYRSHGELLHAKAVVADGASVLFGSANWSTSGFTRNHEIDLEIDDQPAVATTFLEQMAADWAAAA